MRTANLVNNLCHLKFLLIARQSKDARNAAQPTRNKWTNTSQHEHDVSGTDFSNSNRQTERVSRQRARVGESSTQTQSHAYSVKERERKTSSTYTARKKAATANLLDILFKI